MKIIKFIVLPLVLLILIGMAVMAFYYYASYSDGSRNGTVIKLSHKGMIFKTTEGQLDMGTFGANRQANGNNLSTIWDFSVDDSNKEALKALDSAMNYHLQVKLTYEEKYKQFSWRGDTKYFITKVDFIKP